MNARKEKDKAYRCLWPGSWEGAHACLQQGQGWSSVTYRV